MPPTTLTDTPARLNEPAQVDGASRLRGIVGFAAANPTPSGGRFVIRSEPGRTHGGNVDAEREAARLRRLVNGAMEEARRSKPDRLKEKSPGSLNGKLAVEFIGAFILVFTVGLATARTGAGTLAPLAIGSVLMVMVFAGGHVSGGHYNPAISLAVLLRGKLKFRDATAYVAVQLLAGALAGLLVRGLSGRASQAALASEWKILVVEFLFTFALAYVVLNVATADDTEGNSYYGLAVGFTVAAGAFAVGGISGGAFNPAVALGASIMGHFPWSHIWVYALADAIGGCAAAGVFLSLQAGGEARDETAFAPIR